MSIVDAIQRAKKLGRERGIAEATGSAQHQQVSQATALAEPAPVQHPPVLAPAVPLHERSTFDTLQYDIRTCSERHIVLPGTDEQMQQMAAPSYRILRARILQRCRTNGWWKIALTSPGPGEGKSTTALNLAVSIAREGNCDVFLLDLDLRNPSICRYLGVSPKVELSEFFNGQSEERDVFFGIGMDRLAIAGSVVGNPHASELLATNCLERLLGYIRSISSNPLVLIDLPPVVNTDDALVIAPRVDAAVLVVSEGITRRDSLDRAIGLLADFNIAGVILNRTNQSVGSEYYGAYS